MNFNDIDRLLAWGDEHMLSIDSYLEAASTQYPQLKQELLDLLSEDPLARRFMRQLGSPNRFPWQAQAERIIAAMLFLELPMREGCADVTDIHRYGYATQLLTAQVYLWTDDMWKMAEDYPLPRHTISRNLLPYPLMFWSFEKGYRLTDASGADLGLVDWFFLAHSRDGVTIFYPVAQGTQAWLSYYSIRYNTTYPNDYSDIDRQSVSCVLARLGLLNSPYIDPNLTLMDRSTRRSLERQGGHLADKARLETSVVRLRHAANRTMTDSDSGSREYHHRWWVSGHFRAQWYPSEQAHQLIWIAPYLKGPEDKPILHKTYLVER